jgi:branched-chain amino acid transport system permease protein
VNIIIWIAASGFFSAAIGVLFGLPSLRIKGFYLAVATLAAQFFLSWCFIRQPWFYNYNVSGAIEVPTRSLFGCRLPARRQRKRRVISSFSVSSWS